jgi:hypothetical protein
MYNFKHLRIGRRQTEERRIGKNGPDTSFLFRHRSGIAFFFVVSGSTVKKAAVFQGQLGLPVLRRQFVQTKISATFKLSILIDSYVRLHKAL